VVIFGCKALHFGRQSVQQVNKSFAGERLHFVVGQSRRSPFEPS
jgi:hypothetical protein